MSAKKTLPAPKGRKLGQHFLFDQGILTKMADTAELTKEDYVLEIGPGLGTLTEHLAQRAGQVVAVELDGALLGRLQARLAPYDNCVIIHGDIMKIDLREIWMTRFQGKPFKLVANLPYYITTPIIMLFLESGLPVKRITVMVQKEVADRLVSPPGSREYGAISVAVQYRAKVERAFLVPAGAFSPPPRVQSAVLNMTVRESPPVVLTDEGLFQKTVRGCFSSRRKMLRNNISATYNMTGEAAAELISRAGLSPTERAEQLGLQQFADLANYLYTVGYRN